MKAPFCMMPTSGKSINNTAMTSLVFLFAAVCYPVLAQGCTKSSNVIDKLLCSDAHFRRADHDMADAYFQLLRSTSDHDMREGIIASQRRWIKARASEIAPSTDMSDGSQSDEGLADRQAILKATEDRHFQLIRRATNGYRYAMIAEMEKQKKQLSGYSGGPYQGFTTECSFLHPPFGDDYFCTSTISVQKGDHVCIRSLEWASGHQSLISIVGSAKSGQFELQAICKEGYTDNYPACPDPDRARVWPQHKQPTADDFGGKPVGWDRSSTLGNTLFKGPYLKLDPEATFDGSDEYENSRFLARCAKDASFPRKSIRKTLASPHAD